MVAVLPVPREARAWLPLPVTIAVLPLPLLMSCPQLPGGPSGPKHPEYAVLLLPFVTEATLLSPWLACA
jgi:hypothetical protein